MTSRRVGAGAVTVNRLLFILGGFDGANRLKTVECYYPELNEWRFVAPMHTARSGAGTHDVTAHIHLHLTLIHIVLLWAGVCVLDQSIYVVGGYDNCNHLPTVERYDVDTNQWGFVKSMYNPRGALGVAVVNNKIYAVGECHVIFQWALVV